MTNETFYTFLTGLSSDDPSIIENLRLDKNQKVPTIIHGPDVSIMEFAVIMLSANVVKYLLYNGASVTGYVLKRLNDHLTRATEQDNIYDQQKLNKLCEIENVLLPFMKNP